MTKAMATARLLGILLILTSLGCSRKPFKGTSYVSFREGNQYQFSGMPIRWEVERSMRTPRGWEFDLSGRDSLGSELMRQHYLRQDGQLLWIGVEGEALGNIEFRFEPGLGACPFSDRVGQTQSYASIEKRSGPQNTRLRIGVNSKIEAVEDVSTPAGRFEKCIKVSAVVTYLDSTSSPFFSGRVVWWYARGIGVVKSQSPEGESELIFAKIGDRTLP